MDLYQGDFLADFYLPDNQDFNDWLTLRREVFQKWVSDALNKLALIYEGRGEVTNAIEYCRQLTNLEPWNEENHRSLMRLLALSGTRSAALRHYQVCCDSLRRELDVEPSSSTVALYEEIIAWEPGAFPDQEPPQNPVVPVNPEIGPVAEITSKPFLRRKLTRRSMLGLIAAGLIIGIGLVYWAGLPNALGRRPDPGEQDSAQITLAARSSTEILPLIVTELEALDISPANPNARRNCDFTVNTVTNQFGYNCRIIKFGKQGT